MADAKKIPVGNVEVAPGTSYRFELPALPLKAVKNPLAVQATVTLWTPGARGHTMTTLLDKEPRPSWQARRSFRAAEHERGERGGWRGDGKARILAGPAAMRRFRKALRPGHPR
jgi:hypothetical protein